jgi:hypothetical protein
VPGYRLNAEFIRPVGSEIYPEKTIEEAVNEALKALDSRFIKVVCFENGA